MGKKANMDDRPDNESVSPDNESVSSEKALRLAAEKALLKKEPRYKDMNKELSSEEMVYTIHELKVGAAE